MQLDTVIVGENSGENTYFTHGDNLGSLQCLTDESGNIISGAEFSFDPWGNFRNPNDWLSLSDESSDNSFNIIGRGFTGHEHMSEFGLINMNGRVYDRKLGQFIQPDNYIQDPGSSQSYNRFSYCMNNPVNLIDPTGDVSFSPWDLILRYKEDGGFRRLDMYSRQYSSQISGLQQLYNQSQMPDITIYNSQRKYRWVWVKGKEANPLTP